LSDGRFKKAGWTLGLSYVGEHILLFMRTVLVARFIGPEYFGLSVTFLLVVSTFALISDLGIEKYLIHAREQDMPATTATLASVLLARGLLLGLMVWLLSGWIATRFGHPELAWYYASAGLVPLIEGFRHLDPLLQQRKMQYLAYTKVQLGGMLPGILLTIGLAFVTKSYVAMVAGCIAQSVISVALSHILAKSPYRLGFDRTAFAGLFTYGWPLMLNGIVIFLATQGDRIVIATMNGMRELAGYVAVSALTVGASVFLARLSGNLYLPLLSEVRGDPERYSQRCRTCAAASVLMLSAFLFPMALLGAPIVALLFGDAYRIPPLLAALLSIQAATVVLRSWPVVIALSVGATGDILTANIIRIAGLGGAVLIARTDYGITGVAACMVAGDVAATFVSLWRSGSRAGSAAQIGLVLALIFTCQSALAIALNQTIDPYAGWLMPILGALAVSVPGMLAALLLSGDLRQRLRAYSMQLMNRAIG